MRTKIALLFSLLTLAITMFVAAASSSQASTTSVDVGITGHTVAGYTSAQQFQELPVVFTMKNHSTTTSTDVTFIFTVAHASSDGSDYTCPEITNHANIDPDTPGCEPGTLRPGKSTSAAIMVTPMSSFVTVTVKGCAYAISAVTDPVSSNNCKTVRIPVG
jgi:hypothetical protein